MMQTLLSATATTSIDRDSRVRVGTMVPGANPGNRRPEFAFAPAGERPRAYKWSLGQWASGHRYPVAQSPMLGQVVTLSPGLYDVWTRITADGETVVDRVGRLRVT